MRNVCVVGWYFRPEFYALLQTLLAQGVAVAVLTHRAPPPPLDLSRFVTVALDNVGLEWGAYDRFLRGIWQTGPTLFLHDDTDATIGVIQEIFDIQSQRNLDVAFVFSSLESQEQNKGHHGRAWIASDRGLRALRARGIWFDASNTGDTTGVQRNRGSHHFAASLTCLHAEDPTLRVGTIIARALDTGFRGRVGVDGRSAAAAFFPSTQERVHA